MVIKIIKRGFIAAVAAVSLLSAPSAFAMSSTGPLAQFAQQFKQHQLAQQQINGQVLGSATVTVSAPEIDVSSAGGGLAVLITALLIAAERVRRS